MAPQGVFHVPKSAVSLSDDDSSDSSRRPALAFVPAYSSSDMPALLASAPARRCSSSPQNTAREVGTDSTPHRRSQLRSSRICSATFDFTGLEDGVSFQALSRAGIGLSNQGR